MRKICSFYSLTSGCSWKIGIEMLLGEVRRWDTSIGQNLITSIWLFSSEWFSNFLNLSEVIAWTSSIRSWPHIFWRRKRIIWRSEISTPSSGSHGHILFMSRRPWWPLSPAKELCLFIPLHYAFFFPIFATHPLYYCSHPGLIPFFLKLINVSHMLSILKQTHSVIALSFSITPSFRLIISK